MRLVRVCALLIVVVMAGSVQAEPGDSGFSLEVGPEFWRGLDDSSSGGPYGLAAGCAFGWKTSERLWLGIGLEVSIGGSGEWSDAPTVFSLLVGGRWWFFGSGSPVYVPVFVSLSYLTQEGYSRSKSWMSPGLSAGLGVSLGARAGIEARYFRAFDAEERSYREMSLDYSSVGLFFVYAF
jgi:hypothetical protein